MTHTVTKLRLKPPSDEPAAGRRIFVTRRPRSGRKLRQLLKPKTCLIRTDIGFRRCLGAAVLAFGIAVPAHADVTLKQTTSGKGMGMSGKTSAVTYIKGSKMRSDVVMGDKTQTTIFDIDAQKMYIFDSKKKEADVWDMAAFASEISKSVDMSNNAPGSADYGRFYKAAVEKGWIFTDPRAAKAQPGQAKAMAEMYNQMAATGGIPYETEVQIKLGGGGPMGGLLAKIGNVSMTTIVDSVETGSLAEDLFAPPAGYKVSPKK